MFRARPRRAPRAFAAFRLATIYLSHCLLLKWVVVKYTRVPLPVAFLRMVCKLMIVRRRVFPSIRGPAPKVHGAVPISRNSNRSEKRRKNFASFRHSGTKNRVLDPVPLYTPGKQVSQERQQKDQKKIYVCAPNLNSQFLREAREARRRACAPGCLRARNPRVAMMAWNPVPLCGAPYGCRTPGSPRGLGPSGQHDVVWNLAGCGVDAS
jgi:hypothetical protein